MNNTATTNTSIPVTKMVNDLFLQWLSLTDTRTTLYTALQSVQTHNKMPDPINYPKIYITRGGGFSKPQHFDSPPVSPVPRAASSPRNGLSSIPSTGEYTPGQIGQGDERKQRSLKKKYPVLNDSTSTLNATITSNNVDQQQCIGIVDRSVFVEKKKIYSTRDKHGIIRRQEDKETKYIHRVDCNK